METRAQHGRRRALPTGVPGDSSLSACFFISVVFKDPLSCAQEGRAHPQECSPLLSRHLPPGGWLAHGIPERATCHLQHPLTRTGHTEPESRPVTRVRQARPAQLTRHSLRGPLACLIQTKPSPQTIPSWVARLVGSGGVPKVSPLLPNIHPPYISLLQIEEGLQLLLRETETQRDRDGEETRLGQMPLPRSCSLTLGPDFFFFSA